MALKLVIRSRGQGGLGTKSTCVFGTEGGTIGRGADCTWVLVDPRNEVSSLHATIVHEGGQFCLIDESTNGVFINGTSRPLGRGVKVALRQGDSLRLGQYEIGVILGSGAEDATASELSVADGYGLADLVTGQAEDDEVEAGEDGDADAARAGYGSFSGAPEKGERAPRRERTAPRLDPLAAFDGPSPDDQRGPFSATLGARGGSDEGLAQDLGARPPAKRPATEEDAADGIAGSFRPQSIQGGGSGGSGGNDFDRYLDGLSEPQDAAPFGNRGPAAAPTEVRAPASAGISAIDQAMTTLSPQNHNLWPLMEALGLTHVPIPDERIPGLLRDIGAALRQAIEGLHEAYASHDGAGDPSFRISSAQLQPLEDNPIKFADSGAEAVAVLFNSRRAVHLGAEDAVRECLEGMRIHRAAVATGTAAGLQAVVASFGPDALARRFAKYAPDAGLAGDGGWLWDMFTQYFEEAGRHRSHGLRRLFDEVYAQSYDRHVRDSLRPGTAGRSGGPPPEAPQRHAWG